MGRLPATFGGRIVTARQPWAFAGEISLTTGQSGAQFPDATFQNSTDRPFEIHRMIPFVIAQDSANVALPTVPDQDLLSSLVKIKIIDLGKGPNSLVKSSTRIRNLVKGSTERTWELADPYYLAKSEQLQVICDALTFPTISNLNNLVVVITFEGFFITIGPPSDAR
jgi:hypothetical protein